MGQRKHKIKGSQAKARHHALFIDGSAVTASASTAGLDEGGSDFTVSKSANVVTLTPNEAFKRAPVVVASALTANCTVQITTRTATSIVLTTVQDADGSTGVNDADINVMIDGWDSESQQ
jgi:hypothetical protein